MPQGKKGQLGWGFEPSAGTQATSFYFLRYSSLEFSPKRPYEYTKNMHSRGLRLQGFNEIVQLPFKFSFEPDVNTLTRLRAHLRGFASIATAGGVSTWTLRDLLPSDSLASPLDTISLEADRDDSYATLLLNGVLEEMDLKIEKNKLVSVTCSGMAGHYTHLADAANLVTAGTFSGRVLVRGKISDPENTTDDIKVKVTTGGALNGTAQVKFTRGATAYGSTTYPVTAGQWITVILADDNPNGASGDPLEPLQIMFTSGGTLSLNDEWAFDAKRAKQTATYSSLNPLHAVGATFAIGGTSYVIENCDIKFQRPRTERRGCGSKFTEGFVDDGIQKWSISLTRQYTDRALYNLLTSGASATFDVNIYGDRIGSTTSRERWRLYFPAVQVSDAGADPTTEKHLQEKITLEAYFDASNPDCTETIVNSLPSLT